MQPLTLTANDNKARHENDWGILNIHELEVEKHESPFEICLASFIDHDRLKASIRNRELKGETDSLVTFSMTPDQAKQLGKHLISLVKEGPTT